ncbi:Ferredoxin [Candidatus Nanobsidianus stetteri]|uniref:Ferredoxin n=1 Tax=Nanobsidianus stetteri TaxID=1294122 RepID=R1G9L7_NANST|nr:Ferredoxin [Candidatus Nanobsidianus stetteri]
MKIKTWINKDTCIGCGTCIAVAPEIYEFDSDGKSKAKIEIIEDPNLIEKAKDAEVACPTHSVKVEELNN